MYLRDYHNPENRATLEPIGGLRQIQTAFTMPTRAGENVTETTALNIAALFRAGTVLAQSQAQIPVEVVKDKKISFDVVPDHRVADIMNLDANANDTAFIVREQIAWDAFWYGDGFAEVEFNGAGLPVAYHYLQSWRCHARWKQDKTSVTPNKTWVREYVVDNKESEPRSAKEIFHLPGLQFDGLRGKGIVRIARESLALTMAMESHGATTFGNNGIPAGVIETPYKTDDETKSRMRESFKRNAKNDIAVIDAGDKFTPLGLSNLDTQFLEGRIFQVIEVSRWSGVPPHLLMDMSKANYNSLELIGGEFKALTLVPWCERWRGETRRKLFSTGEQRLRYDVRYDYDAFLRADRKTRYDAHSKGITSGFLTRNEARIEEGMPPLEGGDELLIPLNMVPINEQPDDGNTQPQAGKSGDTGGTGE